VLAQQVVLARVPRGAVVEDDLRLAQTTAPTPDDVGDGQLLVRVLDLSIDPYLRGALVGQHLGSTPVPVGGLVPGRSVAEVVVPATGHAVGTLVVAETGWLEWSVVSAAGARPITVPEGVPPSAALGVLGMPGLAAYAAVTRLMALTPGDTVVVSAATGAVGSTAGQLARLAGCRTVAVVGGAEKAGLATDHFGYTEAVDRLAPDWTDRLRAACPDGIDAYLDNAGGDVLRGVVAQLARGARVVLCGLMDQYNDGPASTLPAGPIIGRRATVHGLVVYDHEDLWPRFTARVGELLHDGRMRLLEERHRGLAQAPAAFCRLMRGANVGKVIVEVASSDGTAVASSGDAQ
jgi:NADPH-dependent curcumin reductase